MYNLKLKLKITDCECINGQYRTKSDRHELLNQLDMPTYEWWPFGDLPKEIKTLWDDEQNDSLVCVELEINYSVYYEIRVDEDGYAQDYTLEIVED